jgi:hypothetical protein
VEKSRLRSIPEKWRQERCLPGKPLVAISILHNFTGLISMPPSEPMFALSAAADGYAEFGITTQPKSNTSSIVTSLLTPLTILYST